MRKVLVATLPIALSLVVILPVKADHLDPYEDLVGCSYDYDSGTSGNDVLVGSTTSRDTLLSYAGNDTVKGLGCGDYLDGGDNVDTVRGAHGNDEIYLGNGHDQPFDVGNGSGIGHGGAGHDNMYGGNGQDFLFDHQDSPADIDRMYGEDSNDTINVQDGDSSDSAVGGAGSGDVCIVDSNTERAPSCET